MKKKLLSLLVLLAAAVSGAWAQDANLGIRVKVWKTGDTFDIGEAWFMANDQNEGFLCHSSSTDGIVPSFTYDEESEQWKGDDSWIPFDKRYLNGNMENSTGEQNIYITPPAGRAKTDHPLGVRVKTGSGTQADPYQFELVYFALSVDEDNNLHGTISFTVGEGEGKRENTTAANEGDVVTLSVSPDKGWVIGTVTASTYNNWENAGARRRTQDVTIPMLGDVTLTPVEGVDTAWTFQMPAASVEASATYIPVAAFALEENTLLEPTAAEGVIAGEDKALINEGTVAKIGQTEDPQGTVKYFATLNANMTAEEALAVNGWTPALPTAAGYTGDYAENFKVYVWYYIQAAEGYADSEPQCIEVTVGRNLFNLTLKPAPVDKVDVTIDAAAATPTQYGKIEGVKMGKEVELKAKTGYKFRKVEAKKGVDTYSKILSCSPSYIGRVICTDGSIFVSSTEAAAEGKTAVAVIAYVNTVNKTGLALALTNQGQMNWENAKTSCADKNTSTPVTGGTWKLPSQSEWFQMLQGLGGYTAMNNVFASFGGDNLTNNYWSSTPNGNEQAVYYRSSNGGWGATARTQGAVFVRACLEFNINLLISDDMTEATFTMPDFDATVEYEMVRDMSVQMTAQVGDGTEEQPRYRVQKVEGDYVPADLNAQQVMALFSVTDLLENNKVLTQTTDYTVNIYAIDDQGEPTGDAMTFANFAFEPGHYAVKAVAVDGSYYDGETALSNIFILYEKEITVHPEAIEGLIYSGEPQVLITPAECIGGEMRYSLDGENWSADLPEATDEGTYTVYYKVIADENDDDPFYETVENIVITEMPYEEALAGLYEAIYHASVVLANGQYNRTKQACEELEAVIYQGAQLYIVAHRVGSNVTSKQVVDMIVALRHAEEAFLNSEEVVTGIDNVNANLDDNGKWYDLNGRRLQGKPTTQGVYILNGKKVMVK